MKKLVLILAILFMAAPASASPTVLGNLATYVTTNTDVDTGAEAIIASTETTAPTLCEAVTVCNGANPISGGGGVVRVLQSKTVLSGTLGGVASVGFPLYPLASSGETCLALSTFTDIAGRKQAIDPRQLYVAASKANSSATLVCTRYK